MPSYPPGHKLCSPSALPWPRSEHQSPHERGVRLISVVVLPSSMQTSSDDGSVPRGVGGGQQGGHPLRASHGAHCGSCGDGVWRLRPVHAACAATLDAARHGSSTATPAAAAAAAAAAVAAAAAAAAAHTISAERAPSATISPLGEARDGRSTESRGHDGGTESRRCGDSLALAQSARRASGRVASAKRAGASAAPATGAILRTTELCAAKTFSATPAAGSSAAVG